MIKKLEQLNESLWINETLWKCEDTENFADKFGVCDNEYNIILPLIYDEISSIGKKQLQVKKDDKIEYFDVSGLNLVKCNIYEAGSNGNVRIKD